MSELSYSKNWIAANTRCISLGDEERRPLSSEDLSRKLGLIIERLDALESIVLENPQYAELATLLRLTKASLGLYAEPVRMVARSKSASLLQECESPPEVEARLFLKGKRVKVCEETDLELQLTNNGHSPALLVKVEEIVPPSFEIVEKSGRTVSGQEAFDMNRRRLDPLTTEDLKFTFRSLDEGTFTIRPKTVYTDTGGHRRSCETAPLTIEVVREVLPNRISTGTRDLDSLLFGGVPKGYAIVLTSPSCDERDLLIRRFVEEGIERDQTTFHLSVNPTIGKKLSRKEESNLYLFVCNPQVPEAARSFPNVFKLKGVENLTEISIALSKAFNGLARSTAGGRACIEIVSDVLLQHGPIQTRRWLANLLAKLKSKTFTVWTVVNPQMHSPHEVHAITGLFDGEISIYERDVGTELRYLRIKRMHDEGYLESELRLRKERLRA